MKFVVYEVWTRSQVVEARDEDYVYTIGQPEPVHGMSLCNWHAVAIPETAEKKEETTCSQS